jgi:hypothetical protein
VGSLPWGSVLKEIGVYRSVDSLETLPLCHLGDRFIARIAEFAKRSVDRRVSSTLVPRVDLSSRRSAHIHDSQRRASVGRCPVILLRPKAGIRDVWVVIEWWLRIGRSPANVSQR